MLSKGKKVYIEGRLNTSSWEGSDGAKRQRTEIVADNFIPLSPKDSSSFDVASAITGDDKKTEPKTQKKEDKKDSADEINLDDIPF